MRSFLPLVLLALSASAQSLTGAWQATIEINGVEYPFRIELASRGRQVQGWFFNGDQRVLATSASFKNGSLILNFDHYATQLRATLKDGVLEGQYGPYQKKLRAVKA